MAAVTPTLEQSAQKVAAYLADTIPQAGDFVIEQAPDVVQQIVTLDLYRSLGIALAFVIASAAVFALSNVFRIRWRDARVLYEQQKASERYPSSSDLEGWCAGTIIAWVASGLLWIGVTVHLYNAIGPAFAPKAHLLERIGVLK